MSKVRVDEIATLDDTVSVNVIELHDLPERVAAAETKLEAVEEKANASLTLAQAHAVALLF